MRTDWMADAACAGSQLDFYDFYKHNDTGEPGESVDEEKVLALVKVCARCPVLRDCARFAMRADGVEQFGVWAGSTPRERLDAIRGADDPVAVIVDKGEARIDAAYKKAEEAEQTKLPLGATGTEG